MKTITDIRTVWHFLKIKLGVGSFMIQAPWTLSLTYDLWKTKGQSSCGTLNITHWPIVNIS